MGCFDGVLTREIIMDFADMVTGRTCARCGKDITDGSGRRGFVPAGSSWMAYVTQETYCPVCYKVTFMMTYGHHLGVCPPSQKMLDDAPRVRFKDLFKD